MEKNFIRVRSTKDIVISASIVIIGSVLAAIPGSENANICGYTLIVTGIILAFVLKNGFKDAETREIYFTKELSFLGNMKERILSALVSTPETIDLSEEGKGQVLMLKIYYGKKSGKAYLQLFEYIPHQYEPCSDMYEYKISIVEKLLK